MASATTRLKEATRRTIRGLIPAHIRFQRAGRAFLASGEREVHELSKLVEPGTTAIDVGALLGDYAFSLCRQVGPSGQVICVEPQPEYARLLRTAAARLKLPMEVVECALSSRPGRAELGVPVVDGRARSGFASLDHRGSAGKTIAVELRRLDDVVAEVTRRISFLKVDVEGHELEVFKGAVETLRRHRPNLLVEIEQRHSLVPIAETFAFLKDRAYAGSYLDAEGARVPLEQFDAARNAELAGGERTNGTPAPGYVANFIFTPA